MRVGVPATEAKIKSTHEGNLSIDETELFVMSPEEDDIVDLSVQRFEGIFRQLAQIVQRKVLEA
jgi:hypothetical protein